MTVFPNKVIFRGTECQDFNIFKNKIKVKKTKTKTENDYSLTVFKWRLDSLGGCLARGPPRRFPTPAQLGATGRDTPPSAAAPHGTAPWLYPECLKSPKAVTSGLVGGGDLPPHLHKAHPARVECALQALLDVNQWDLEGGDEVWIFGQSYYQKDALPR